MPSGSTHEHPQQERSDIDLRKIVLTGICLIVIVVSASVFADLFIRGYSIDMQSIDASTVHPKLLRSDPSLDRRAAEQDADRRLHGYATVKDENGYARIPIDRAMQLMTESAKEKQ